ncbi:MAG: hypothetical protein K0S74_1324 [Chlamydiales bacterium]|jgi:predicted RNase H-like nuclease (RuvC/YqgF family)|nr:hypothetical protein [Chlamydiales bacterium]
MFYRSYRNALYFVILLLYIVPVLIFSIHLRQQPLQLTALIVWAGIGCITFNLLIQNWQTLFEEKIEQLETTQRDQSSLTPQGLQQELQKLVERQDQILAQQGSTTIQQTDQLTKLQQTFQNYQEEYEKKLELIKQIAAEGKRNIQILTKQLEDKNSEIEMLQRKLEEMEGLKTHDVELEQACKAQEKELHDMQQTIDAQNLTIKKQEKKIVAFEAKIRDLNYEIITLLQLDKDQRP